MKITAVCLSATIQKTITFDSFTVCKVNRSKRYVLNASGKAINSARVLNQLKKGCCDVVCPIGEQNKERFNELAQNEDFTIKTVMIPGFTRECWTLLDEEKKQTTELVISEPVINTDMSKKTEELLDLIDNQLKSCDALLLAGSRPEIWPNDTCAKICNIAKEKGKIVMADFWGKDLQKTMSVCNPDIIKINEEEFCGTFSYDFPQSPEKLLQLICKESINHNCVIVVTRGSQTTFAAQNGVPYTADVKKVNLVNTTGCGDTFSAGFLFEYIQSKDMKKSLALGTECAAKNAERELPGTIL